MMEQMERSQQWLEKLLLLMGMPVSVTGSIREKQEEDSEAIWLTIEEAGLTAEQIEALIGPGGSTLDAIQYLANTVLNLSLESDSQRALTVELHGYRVQRQAQLRALVEKVAQQVRETGEEAEMTDLSSAERRQVHHFLKQSEDLESISRGQEPHRRLVVRLRS
ncbi:MAG: protein jag [Cyanobacteriota bacterium]